VFLFVPEVLIGMASPYLFLLLGVEYCCCGEHTKYNAMHTSRDVVYSVQIFYVLVIRPVIIGHVSTFSNHMFCFPLLLYACMFAC